MERILILFVSRVQGIHTTLPLISDMLKETHLKAEKQLVDFYKTKCETEVRNGKLYYIIEAGQRFKHRTLKRNVNHVKIANSIVKENFIVSLVSQFDAFLGSLIRLMYISKPEMLNSSERDLKFSQTHIHSHIICNSHHLLLQ